MAKPPQQERSRPPGSVAGIMQMLGGPGVGIGGGGGNPGMGMPQGGGMTPGLGGPRAQRNPNQFKSFEEWLSGIYGQMGPPPDADLAALYQRYQQEAGQWAGQGGVGDQIQSLLMGRQYQDAARQRPGDQGRIGTSRGRY